MGDTFGERVKLLRTKSNVTQKELAENLGISPASVIAYEKGQKSPSVDVALRIAQFFGVSLDSLCTGQNPETELKTYGDIARALCVLLKAGCLSIRLESIDERIYDSNIDEYTSYSIGARASLVFPRTYANDWSYLPSPENDFVVNYHKMHTLLKDNTLTQDIFDTWLESQLSKLDATPIEDVFDLDCNDSDLPF